MEYASQVWSGGPTQSLQRLQDSFCKRHGIRLPPLQTRFDYHSLVLLYKMRSSLAPPYLCTLLPQRASTTTGYSIRKSGYPVPATRKSSTLSSFVPRAIVVWNALPKEIQEFKTLTMFTTRLRTHLQYVSVIAWVFDFRKFNNRCIITIDVHSLRSDREHLFTAWAYQWTIDKIPSSMGVE